MHATINRRAAIAVATAAAVGAVAAVAHAAPVARQAATPLRIVFNAHHEDTEMSPQFPVGIIHVGTFTSASPFCDSGTAADTDWGFSDGKFKRRYTCEDGSGSLTFSISPSDQVEHQGSGTYRIVEGTGSYAGLHGKLAYRGETLSGDPAGKTAVFRVTAEGFVDRDAVAPTLSIFAASVTKLRRPAGAYAVRVSLALSDGVDSNAVDYTINLLNGRKPLATSTGTSTSGSASTTLVLHATTPRPRSVQLVVVASDPVGNETTQTRTVVLPR